MEKEHLQELHDRFWTQVYESQRKKTDVFDIRFIPLLMDNEAFDAPTPTLCKTEGGKGMPES